MTSIQRTELSSSAVSEASSVQGESLWSDAWKRLQKNKMAVAGGLFLVLLVIAALVGPWLLPYRFDEQNLNSTYAAPTLSHWMGTDGLGRDLLARLLMGARISLGIGFVATLVSILIGLVYGAISGYLGGWADEVMMRVVDIMYGLPYMFLVIILMVILPKLLGSHSPGQAVSPYQSFLIVFIVLGAFQWLTMARIVRGQVLSLKEKEFVEAAEACGAKKRRILFVHIVPNLLGPVIVYSTLTVPQVILGEAFLSFIGLGIQAPLASWGTLAAEAMQNMNPLHSNWWLVVFPGLFLAITLFSLNFVGDGLRDALDPQMRGKI